ncbi:glutathione S-transferase family protein [Zoogloeaceae bacterium G21618-S1]|uniref:Glutathione S-transferase family protein n=1 Tax=Denitromonas halophila TaxID=1629404 RepID=A0A557R2G1_9RHOO|nr:glutathione S-transferase family protein [Denitromonas halophila]MCZ4305661.1 glutathione S-transferase family protein [Zoogloeaceae bacterium G21618-S1]TVO59351.1 glutathione S-transferase family protein [Denitromonas halophila]
MSAAIAATDIRLHGLQLSGHSHRISLFLSLLQLPHEHIEVDLPGGAHKRPEFLAMNPFGQVPVLQDGALTLPDSNAILVYLAKRYGGAQWLPTDSVGAARVQRWLSVAAGPLASGPAMARIHVVFGKNQPDPALVERSHALLAVMDAALADSPFLVGEAPTIADIACYSYTAHAPEGGVGLAGYPNVCAWLARIEALPHFVGMPATPLA